MKLRNNLIQNVLELHHRVGYKHPSKTTLGSKARRNFWMMAIDEEISELRNAILQNDTVGVADAIGDAVYVLLGASLAFGIPFEQVFQEIHEANMTKDVIYVEGVGKNEMEKKLVKGELYSPPNIAAILADYCDPQHESNQIQNKNNEV